MSPLWSKLLERLGRLRLAFSMRRKLTVGDPRAADAMGGTGWRAYLTSEVLYEVWGPHPESPWLPFHCVPLFAALDRLWPSETGPSPPHEERTSGRWASVPPLPMTARPGAPRPTWLEPGTMTILDLPGHTSVEAAAWLITSTGCQPVCTFDNWPHAKGVVHPEDILAEMLRWATTVADVRFAITPTAPPVWICDSFRLGRAPASANQFDNRYYLDDSVLPGSMVLRSAQISRLVYVTMSPGAPPTPDIEGYLGDMAKAGLDVRTWSLIKPTDEPAAYQPPPKPRKFSRSGFRRSSAGGFGTEVPDSSSGSSGG